jgi:diguanylate cyclase (GGDEF)-like protein
MGTVANAKCSLLIVDDEHIILETLSRLLSNDFDVLAVDSAEAAQRVFGERTVDLVLADQNLPGMSGVQLLAWIQQHSPRTIRLMMTGLARLEDAVDAINCGQVYRFLCKPWRTPELLQVLRSASRTFLLERSNEQLLEQLRQLNLELEERVLLRTQELEESNHQLQQRNSMLEKLALTDSLTGLPNRRAMDRVAKSELRRRDRYPSSLALGVIDIDHFKEINRRYLLPGGDQVLVTLAKTMAGSLRTVDSLGRIGGEEFLVVAPETDVQGATVLAERIRLAVERCRSAYNDETIAVTVSLGFAVAETGIPADYEEMKHLASAALGEAKASGRNRCVVRALPPPHDRTDQLAISTTPEGEGEPSPLNELGSFTHSARHQEKT